MNREKTGGKEHKSKMLVDSRWLSEHRRDPGLVLIDTRPAKDFRNGHLDGARHFDPFPFHHTDTSERGVAEFGAQLQWIFSALGIGGHDTVVFYEDESGMRAARGAWALEYAGHPKARMLDGALKATHEKLTSKGDKFAATDFTLKPRAETLASYMHLLERIGRHDVQIFDVRSDAEYYSERVRAKHGGAIPGAIHQDWSEAQGSDGAMKSPSELRAQYQALGLDPAAEIVPYCQGGYRAAHAYVALKVAGYSKRPQLLRVVGGMGQSRRLAQRASAPQDHRASLMPPILILTGFEPFRGERINPSWEIARSLDGEVIAGMQIKSVRVPVGCAKAARRITGAIVRYRPRAIIGLGEAGGRPAISLERIAINLADERGALARSGDPGLAAVVRGGPDAYFSRLPLSRIIRELDRKDIPASVSLTAGAYACNALMYAALHNLRRKPAIPVGFIHLPYEARQAGRHRSLPSMPLATMETAVRIAIAVTARSTR